MAESVPFSEKFTEIEELPRRHPLRISLEMKQENPFAEQVLADFYRVRSHQEPMLEQTYEAREWMGYFAAAYERLMVSFHLETLQKKI